MKLGSHWSFARCFPLPCVGIGNPHLCRIVVTTCHYPITLWRERNRVDITRLSRKREYFAPSSGIPHPCRIVRAPRHNPGPVWRERNGKDTFCMPFEGQHLFACLGVPHL